MPRTIHLTNRQARQFVLLKQGLLGEYRFEGKAGTLAFIRQAGCIQFDPVDVCGRNPDLVLNARIKDFNNDQLTELLYEDRQLVDYWDKNMSIFPLEDWPNFHRHRVHFKDNNRSREHIEAASEQVMQLVREKGFASSKELDMNDRVDWFWAPTALGRAALESLYYQGDLMIHHRVRSIRYYGAAEDLVAPEILRERDPNPTLEAHYQWRIKRRIGALGLLWNKASDAWLGIIGFKAADRNRGFAQLIEADELIQVIVEGIKEPLYALKADEPLLEAVQSDREWEPRLEFIAPLDNLMWDRKLIKALFDFDYKWEIYTPEAERKYGHYVLPVLYGESFAGRIEVVRDAKAKAMVVKNFWPEPAYQSKKAQKNLEKPLKACLKRLGRINKMA